MPIPTKAPAGYAPQIAVAFATPSGDAQLVQADAPLPVMPMPFVAPAPLAGATSLTSVVGPFRPEPGRAVILALAGTGWTGQVRVLRSTDLGVTKLPLTAVGLPFAVFTANACEPIWEESEADGELYLDIALTAGTINYRMGQ